MNIQLQHLALMNFKGIREFSVDFSSVTDIYGDNAVGKTTLFDAFTWLLFGKDSHDSKDFNIKTLDENGNVIPRIDHSVEGILVIDDQETTLKRVYSEKWTRRRGSEESELTGHETQFFKNGVPMQAKEYATYIDSIISENLFKMLTSVLYFNSLKWTDRRAMLIKMAGTINKEDVFSAITKQHAKDIEAILNSGKALAEWKREMSAKKKTLSYQLEAIPSRVDEVDRSMPEPQDYALIEREIAILIGKIQAIENTITDQAAAYQEKADEISGIQQQIYNLKKRRSDIEYTEGSRVSSAATEKTMAVRKATEAVQSIKNRIQVTTKESENITASIAKTNETMARLRKEWEVANADVFKPSTEKFICPTCKREVDPSDAQAKLLQMENNFNAEKARKLTDINENGKRMKDLLQTLNSQLADKQVAISELNNELAQAEATLADAQTIVVPTSVDFASIPEWVSLGEQIAAMELRVMDIPKLDTTGLKQQKNELTAELSGQQHLLSTREFRSKAEARRKELLDEERRLAQHISDIERGEFAIDAYTKAQMDVVEQRVNGMFTLVKFKMFNTLVNGGTEECCEATVGGVPYSDVNSAGKINAGLDCINTMSRYFNIYATVWVDNAETVNTMIPVSSQVVRLIVSKDQSLTIK